MKKAFTYGFKSFVFYWEANGLSAFLVVFAWIYDSTLYPLIQVFLLAKALDIFTQIRDVSFQDVTWVIIPYISASLLRIMLKAFLGLKETFLQTQLEGHIDLKIAKKLTELDPATFENPEFQDLLAQLEGIKGTFQMQFNRFVGLIDAFVKFITSAIVVSTSFPLFAPFIIIATIPTFIITNKSRISTWPFYVEKRSVVMRVTQYIKNLLSSDSTSKEVTIFHTGATLLGKIKTEQQTYFQKFNKATDYWIFPTILTNLVEFSAFVYTQYLNLNRVFQGSLGIGQFTLIFQQTITLTFGAGDILNLYSSMSARNKYLEKFFDFLNMKKTILSPSKPVSIPDSPNPPTITFKDVSFKYPRTDRYVLQGFNLTIHPGEKVALVGENGAGKTTLIKLLLRFYDVTGGEILVNGINIKEVNLKKWHSYIGAIFQDFIKYQFTFRENISFGDVSKSDKEKSLKKVVGQSGANAFLDDLPKGYNQVVGKMFEGGVDLSGGQWQKLALARAFYRDSPILILDEPTSAIDAKAEYEIFERVQGLQKDKTAIIISHRFSTVRNADRILVLDEGKIVEEGTHQQLLSLEGMYAELFNIQAKGYK